MSELDTPEWNAKILKALKENSRRFAVAEKTATPLRRASRPKSARRTKKAAATRGR